MKKEYIIPQTESIDIKINQHLLAGSNGSKAHTGDPQPPGSAMGRCYDDYNDED